MTVVFAPVVEDALYGIWAWTLDRFGVDQADHYELFLKVNLTRLAETYRNGAEVEDHPGLMRQTFKIRASGDGHIAVYEVDEEAEIVNVVRLLHTKMDLAARLADDQPAK